MNIEAIIEEHAHHFLQGIKTEFDGDKEAIVIIRQYIKTGTISTEQDHILKTQLFDSLKIVGIGIPFVLIPGASILMPILIKVAAKHNVELMPSAFIHPVSQDTGKGEMTTTPMHPPDKPQ
jgi:hypothetical protein